MLDEEVLELVCSAYEAIEENVIVTPEIQELIRVKVLGMLTFIEEDMGR